MGIEEDIGIRDNWPIGFELTLQFFELLTGDYLFDPQPGVKYDKDDDHMAQVMELLGEMPKSLALSGKYSQEMFTRRGKHNYATPVSVKLRLSRRSPAYISTPILAAHASPQGEIPHGTSRCRTPLFLLVADASLLPRLQSYRRRNGQTSLA